MGQAIEIARFRAKDGSEQQLLDGRPAMLRALRERFPAAGEAYLGQLDDGTWIDIVIWEDRTAAERAAQEVFDHPEIAGWFGHIAEVVGMEHAHLRS